MFRSRVTFLKLRDLQANEIIMGATQTPKSLSVKYNTSILDKTCV